MKRRQPSKPAEKIASILIPTGCREEVLGDLYERYRSPVQYALDVLRTCPLLVMGRVRRALNGRMALIQALSSYLSFLGAARLMRSELLSEAAGLARLAVPAAIILLVSMLEDAYAIPGRRSPAALVRGPAFGVCIVFAWGGVLRMASPEWSIPFPVVVYGAVMSLLLSSALRMLFQPATGRFSK